jgi:transcriptional regulator with XRE-family HTH domain
MTLGEKLRSLRRVEGELRGLGRDMSQQEVVRAIRRELGASFSQSYLSQVESGRRQHLTHHMRQVLARFFKVHPGYLVSDPPGFHTELLSALRAAEEPLDEWLQQGAERFSLDFELADALRKLAAHDDSRTCLLLLGLILDTPHLVDRLFDALRPTADARRAAASEEHP